MSRLIDAVEVKVTGRRKYGRPQIPMAMLSVTEEISNIEVDLLEEVRFQVRYSMKTHCRHSEIPMVRDNFIQSLKHELYSDMISMLHDLEFLVYEQNEDGIRDVINKMREEMTQ